VCYGKNLMPDVRIDKWLWAARFFKSRTLAAGACNGGKVHVNGDAAKPSKTVRPGDMLRVTLPRVRRIVRVIVLAERRGGASEAAALYEDLTPPRRRARPARRHPPIARRARDAPPSASAVASTASAAGRSSAGRLRCNHPSVTVCPSTVSGRPAGCGPQGRRCESAATPSL
jgi:ribosomal 50S subunit-recycling heat shock protein